MRFLIHGWQLRVSIIDFQVILEPEPVAPAPIVAISEPKYWLIAAVICPIVFLILVMVLIFWRWKSGGPVKKIAPGDVEKTGKDVVDTGGRVSHSFNILIISLILNSYDMLLWQFFVDPPPVLHDVRTKYC